MVWSYLYTHFILYHMIHLYRFCLISLCIPLSFLSLQAQTFTVSDTLHEMVFEQDQFVVYSYSTLDNLTDTDLNMGWKKTFPRPFPTSWDNTIEVPDTFYTAGETSGTFILEADPAIPEKVVCQFYPNNTLATANVIVRIFNLADTTEYIDIEWSAKSIPGTTSLDPSVQASRLLLYPNPTQDGCMVEVPASMNHATAKVVDAQGRMLLSIPNLSPGPNRISTTELTAGLYWILLENSEGQQTAGTPLHIVRD